MYRHTLVMWLVFFVLSFLLAFVKVFFPETSPWDEQAHLSHVQYVFQGILPVDGMAIGSWAKEAYSCYPGTLTTIECGQIADARWYPMGGTNSSAFWQPTYFALAAILGAPFVWAGMVPLFAIRIATALIWAIGVASLALILTRRSQRLSTGFLVTLALTAIPLMGYMSSAVTPHSLNPLLAAIALAVAFKWVDLPEATFTSRRSVLWPLAYFGAVLLGAWSIPQSLTIFGTVAVYIAISRMTAAVHAKASLFRESVAGIASIVLTGVVFVVSMSVWGSIQAARAIAPVAEVDLTKSPGSALDISYANPFVMMGTRWASFWPNGLRAGWAQDDSLTLTIELLWVVVALGLTVTAIWKLRTPQWALLLLIAVIIVAPLSSIAYDMYFPSDVPIRYGLGIPVVGLAAVFSITKPKWLTITLLTFAIACYLVGFVVEPMFPFDRGCEMNGDGIVLCAVNGTGS